MAEFLQWNDYIANPAGPRFKMALAYKLNNIGSCINGGVVAVDTTATVPSANQLRLGQRQSDFICYQARFARLSYYNVRKTNAELQALTT